MLDLVNKGKVPFSVSKENKDGTLELGMIEGTPSSIYTAISHERTLSHYFLRPFPLFSSHVKAVS